MMNDTKLKENLFTEWKKSSPYDQCRLSLLEQIDFNDWDKLIDMHEQEEFDLENDEFLIYIDKYESVIEDWFIISTYICGVFFIPILTFERYFKSIESFRYLFLSTYFKLIIIIFMYFTVFWIIYVFIRKRKKYFLITNKKIYFIKSNKKIIKVDYENLSVKSRLSIYGIKKINNEIPMNYKFWINFFFTTQMFSQGISLNYKKNKHELYILKVISFIAMRYNYALYIYPICCAIKNRQKNLFVFFFTFIGPLIAPGTLFTQTHIHNNQEEDIDIRFSSKEKLISFIEKTTFKKHKCKNTILALAMQGRDVPDEELFTVEAKGKIFCKKYKLSVHKNYIELVYKNELLRLGIEEYKKSIFNSNKSFIIIFPYQNKPIFIYAKKKDMDIPFLEIMETLSGVSIPFHRPLLADMWYS